jgi:hypothetical protein
MRKNAIRAGFLAVFLLPGLAFGAEFAKQSLFLSKPSVTEGETVFIHTVVANSLAAAFAGNMVFTDGPTSIGVAPVSLSAGEAAAVSVSWKPTAGSHTVVAELKKGTGTIEKQSATFTIAEKPKPVVTPLANSPQSAATVESSAKIQEGIASLSPAGANAVAPVFTLVDGGRAALSGVLDGQIATTKKNLGPSAGSQSGVLGAEAVKNAHQNPVGTFWFILQTLYLYLLTLLSFIVGSAGVFYPVAAFLVLFMLWRLIRRFRRPAY